MQVLFLDFPWIRLHRVRHQVAFFAGTGPLLPNQRRTGLGLERV